MFLPESPRWLIKKGKFKEGIHNLCALRGLPETDPVLIEERDSIMATYEAQKSEASFELKEIFQQGKTCTLWRVCIAVFIQAAQQLSGINLGLGHRKAFMYTVTGMTVYFIIPILLSTGQHTPQLAAAGFLFLFNTFFGLAWVGGSFLYSAEIAPLRSRAAVNGIASASNWIFCFLVVMTIPTSFANIGYKTYIVYAVLNACFVPIIYFFLVETKGRSLEELDVIFAAEKNPVWNEMRMEKHIDSRQAT
ncbi:hypothetical protein BDD12DRAFT_803958 [Trichophaea hybrida]|nr:hypothetical protein BDD12DRAFT_803958 [Trichophaea hybrida]